MLVTCWPELTLLHQFWQPVLWGLHHMPLQNRVTVFGDIVAHPARGQIFGNRGGRIHRHDKTLSNRRWASDAWIICVLKFKGRQRTLMAPNSYTELFFLDEVTALAAGHRPCFECRRAAAVDFAQRWGQVHGLDQRARAGDMDKVLHQERTGAQKTKTYPQRDISSLPDGAMIVWREQPAAIKGNELLPWTIGGYEKPIGRPVGVSVAVLTPLSTIEILQAGYQPLLHV